MLGRSEYVSSGYSPSEASTYTYGSVIPDPSYVIKKRIALLKKIKDDTSQERLPLSENFQRFMAIQNNPEALFNASVKLPQTPFGNLGSYLSE
jgi:hypothetical protein